MAAEVLALIGGEGFSQLTQSVIRAVDRKAAFLYLLRDMKYLLWTLKMSASIFQQIQELNLELCLSVEEKIAIGNKVSEGRQLVDRLSATNFYFWNFCCRNNEGAEQLEDLRNSLTRLLEILQWRQIRDFKEVLSLGRKNNDLLEKILNIVDQQQQTPEVNAQLNKLLEQKAGNSMEASTSATGSNTENQGKGKAPVASLEELVEAAFLMLSDAVVQVTDKTVMFRPFLRRLKSTLDFLKPFIEDIAQHNKVLNRPKEELEKLRIQMVTGVKLVGACSKVHQWTCSNEKYKYTDQLFKLDESLQWQLSIIIEQVARDMRETSSLIRNIQEVVKKIEGRSILQNQVELECFCDIAEAAIPIVELEAINVQGIRSEMKETFSAVNMNEGVRGIEGGDKVHEVAESQPPTVVLNAQETIEEEVKETLGSTRDVEEDYREIKGSDEVLQIVEPQPPTVVPNVQGTSEEEVKETLESIRDMEEEFEGIGGSAAIVQVAEPQPPTAELDVLNAKGTRDEMDRMDPSGDIEERIKRIERSEFKGCGIESGMENLIAGGAMVVPFNALYDVIKETVGKTKMNKHLLKDLDSTIDSLKPLIDEMEKYNKVLDHPENELKGIKVQMQKGVVLITKWSKVSWRNIYKKYKYTNQLLELESSLRNFYEILAMQAATDVKKTRVEVGHIGTAVQHTDTTMLEVAENVQQNLVTTNDIETVVHRTDVTSLQVAMDVRNIDTVVQRTDETGLQVARVVRNIETVVRQIADNIVVPNYKIDQVRGWGAVPVGAPFTVGVDMPLRELKIKLLKDEKVTMLVLTAPGGCGKTTLAIKFCEDYEVKDKFKENIFFVTVSKKSDDHVVQELYHRTGSKIPTLHNEVDVVKWLWQFRVEVGKNPVLFVLDDVWSGSESLLQKFYDFKLPNSKILVTSRFRFPRFGTQHSLEPLNIEDAATLFKHSASLGDRSCNIPEDIMRKIIEHFKKSPLAITVVGRSLCGKPVESWLKRESTLKGASIRNSEDTLLDGLQSCLDALNEEDHILKECFLDLGSFPEDQRISAAALIDMWAELYKLEDFVSIANLHELAARSLANLLITRKETMEADGYYSEHFITQHDMLRQFAIYQPKPEANNKRRIIDKWGDNLPECLTGQKHQPIKARLLSISSDGVFSMNLDNIELAEVEVLVLNFDTQNYALPEFVVKMDKLKVLIVRNHGFLPAELCNIQLLGSLSNLKRIRLERISISSITKNLIQLKSVKKISLFMCNIGQAFSNCSLQISDALPYLEEMNIDYCNDLVELPAALCALVNLKKLSITNSHKLSALPEEIGKLVNLEVLRLRSCTDLAKLPDSTRNLEKLNFLDIADCFSIRELPEDFGGMSSLKKINMRMCSRLQELPSSVVDLEQLQEVVCDEDTGDLWEPFLPHLKNLHIKPVKENVNLNWLHKLQ